MKNKKLSKDNLELARAMYLSYESVTDIAASLKIDRSALSYHVNEKGWKDERDLLENEMIAAFGAARASKLNLLSKHSTDIIVKALQNLKNRDKPPTMMEARAAVNIFESLDKIMRLDKGTPTDIIGETKPMTIIELKEQFEAIDPFNKKPKEIEDAQEIDQKDSE